MSRNRCQTSRLSATLSLSWLILLAGPAWAQTALEFLPVGDPGNPARSGVELPFGTVPYTYEIGRFEVTNGQYASFLGAVAGDDPNGLWSSFMQSSALGGIERTGLPGAYQYTVKPGMQDIPVVYVSFWDAVRFANWLHNGTPSGSQNDATTEDGSYTLTPSDVANNTVSRNLDATYVIPNWDEWAKAGFYDEITQTWYESPAQSQSQMTGGPPNEDDGNKGNCNSPVFIMYEVGAYTLSASPFGTFDQGGNVGEWSESIAGGGGARRFLGSSYGGGCNGTTADSGPFNVPVGEVANRGFRVARLNPVAVPILDIVPLAGLFTILTLIGIFLPGAHSDSRGSRTSAIFDGADS